MCPPARMSTQQIHSHIRVTNTYHMRSAYSGLTCAACNPFAPRSVTKDTVCPSFRDLKPSDYPYALISSTARHTSDPRDFSKASTHFDSFEVDEEVVSATRRCDKAKAFLVVPRFNYSLLSVGYGRLVGEEVLGCKGRLSMCTQQKIVYYVRAWDDSLLYNCHFMLEHTDTASSDRLMA